MFVCRIVSCFPGVVDCRDRECQKGEGKRELVFSLHTLERGKRRRDRARVPRFHTVVEMLKHQTIPPPPVRRLDGRIML